MQRRRKPKSEPRNIFDKTSGGKPSKSSSKSRGSAPSDSTRQTKPAMPPATPVPKSQTESAPSPLPPPPPQPNTSKTEEKDEPELVQNSILEEQVLGTSKRLARGLVQAEKETEPETEENNSTSSKAMEIIEASKARANAANAKVMAEKIKPKPIVPIKKRFKPRGKSASNFQPATREKRLDRSRHMEYKYEMRGLLKEIEVAEEHQSSLLGSIWAKGERQTTEEARQFIFDKQNEGILNKDQVARLITVVDDYTIRR